MSPKPHDTNTRVSIGVYLRNHWQPFLKRYGLIIDISGRLILLLLFALYLYFYAYVPALANKTFQDPYMPPAIQAANAGYPFYAMSETGEPTRFAADLDYGIPVLVAITYKAGRLFYGEQFQVGDKTVYDILFALYLLTAFFFVMPQKSLPLSIGAILMLSLALFKGPLGFISGQRWGTTYLVLLCGYTAGTAFLPKTNLWNIAALVGISLLAGIGQFIRQEGIIAVQVACVSLVSITWIVAAMAYRRIPDRALWTERVLLPARRITTSAVVFIGMIFVMPFVLRGLYALAWHAAYSDVVIGKHGAGHPLYLGLGYVDNPYNIVWNDATGYVHARLIDPEIPFSGDRYQNLVLKEWGRVITESPWLLNENLIAKSQYVLNRFTNIEKNGLAFSIFAGGVPLVLLIAPLVIGKRDMTQGIPLYFGYLGIIVGASLSPLLVYPVGYLSGLLGATLTTVIMLPATIVAIVTSEARTERQVSGLTANITTRLLIMMAAAATVLFAGWAGWTLIRQAQFRAELSEIANADPIEEIQRQGYRYAHFFNALPVEQQEKIIDQLSASHDPQIGINRGDHSGETPFFRPIVAVISDNKFHLIVWFGKSAPPLLISDTVLNYDYLTIYSNTQPPSNMNMLSVQLDYVTGIHSLAWQDRYQMFSFSIPPGSPTLSSLLIVIRRAFEVQEEIETVNLAYGEIVFGSYP